MALNFNQYPYNDDFSENKNFHKILFKPGVSVQARELTQSQTILQNQISKFGDHVFKNHTVVSGGRITINQQVEFLKLETFDQNNNDVVASNFRDKIVKDYSENIVARVINTEEKILDENLNLIDPPTLILSYLSQNKFQSGDPIYSNSGYLTGLVIGNSSEYLPSSGKSSVASIDEGVFYVDGYFVSVEKQTVTIDEYSNLPSARIGLRTEHTIVSAEDDFSLLDPALGESNFQAPGADRYKIYLRLVAKPLELDDDPDFIELTRIENGVIKKSVNNTEYSELDNYFARRTFDTNGDFIVNRFKVSVEATNDNSKCKVKVGPGKAFVNGYIVDNTSDLTFLSNKARSNSAVTQKLITMNYGNYISLENLVGEFDFNNYQTVDIHCTKFANTTNNSVYNTTIAATAKIRNLDFVLAGDASNSKTYIYNAYFIDVQNKTYTETANAKISVTANTITLPKNYSNVNDAYKGISVRINNGINYGDVVDISSYNGTTKTATLSRNFVRTPVESDLNYSLIFNTKNFESVYKSFGYSNTSATIHASSKTQQLDSGDTFFSNVGDEELVYELGDPFVVRNSVLNSEYYTWMKFSDVSVSTPFSVPSSTVAVFDSSDGTLSQSNAREKFICVVTDKGSSSYDVGDIIPFGSNTTITISSSSSIAQISSSELPGVYANIYAKVYVKNGNEINYSKKIKDLINADITRIGRFDTYTLVTGTSNTYVDLTSAQVYIEKVEFDASNTSQSLFISDVKSIVKIIDTLDPTTAPDETMFSDPQHDITNNFMFDNGQNDFYYDHSKIKLVQGRPAPKGNVLVVCNYYSHEGNGYFDLDSYFINNRTEAEPYLNLPTYISRRGKPYNLRDCVDFRTSRKNGKSEFLLNSYSTKPTGIPIDGTNFKTNYSVYLGRKDIVVASKDKTFSLIEGIPSFSPTEPKKPDGSIILAKITHEPYTLKLIGDVYDPRYSSVTVENVEHKRWRMEDITSLEERVSRVEYYTALNALEQNAQNLQIPDEFGLNRFKNGIITDDFSSYNVSDTEDRDLRCSVIVPEKKLFSTHKVENFDLTLRDNLYAQGRLNSSARAALDYNIDYEGSTGYVTLPYEVVPVASQPFATRTVNVNPFGVVTKDGTLKINPMMDQWVSSTREPDRLINLSVPLEEKLINTGQWQSISSAEVKRTKNLEKTIKNAITLTNGETSRFDQFTSQQLQDFVSVWNVNTSLNPFTQRGQLILLLQSSYANKGIKYTTSQSETVTVRTNLERKLEYKKVPVDFDSANYSAENGYITDVSINPYIRSQQIEFVAERLLFNCSLGFYFDDQQVNHRIREANKITISTGANSQFNYGDILAYYESGSFVKFGKVLNSYTLSENYSNNSKVVRLSIIGDIEAEKYASSDENSYNADVFTVETNVDGIVTNIVSYGNIINYSVKSGKINQKLTDTTLSINKIYADQANTLIGKTLTIITDKNSFNYGIDYAQESNTSITLYCNNSIIASEANNATYTIRDFGDEISTDDIGSVSGVFYLPTDTFTTGEKVFRIDNRFLNNRGSETTFAETKFIASSLSQSVQFLNFAADSGGSGGVFYKSEQSYNDNDIVFPGQETSYQTPIGAPPPSPPPSAPPTPPPSRTPAPPPTGSPRPPSPTPTPTPTPTYSFVPPPISEPCKNVTGIQVKWRGTTLESNLSVTKVDTSDGFLTTLLTSEKYGIRNTQVDEIVKAVKDAIPNDWPEAAGGSNDVPVNVDSLDYTNLSTLSLIITVSEQLGIRNSTIDYMVDLIKRSVDPTITTITRDQLQTRFTPEYLRYLIDRSRGLTGTSGFAVAEPLLQIQNFKFSVTNSTLYLTIPYLDLSGLPRAPERTFSINLQSIIDRNFPQAVKNAQGGGAFINQKPVIKERVTAQYLRYMAYASTGSDGTGSVVSGHFTKNKLVISKISETGDSTRYRVQADFAYTTKVGSENVIKSVTVEKTFAKDKNTYLYTNGYMSWAVLYFWMNPANTKLSQEFMYYGRIQNINGGDPSPQLAAYHIDKVLIGGGGNREASKAAEIIGFNCGEGPTVGVDPICQTFIFYANEYPNGCFIKSIKVFFRSKPLTTGSPITCYLLGTKNGYPDGEYLPHGITTLNPDKIKISDSPNINDSNTYTEFTFNVPVYVKPETLYAFMLKSDSIEYEVYTAKLGDFAIPSSAKTNPTDPDPTSAIKVSSTPYVGELFLSQNTLTWAPDQNQDMMFQINRCQFDTSKKPTIEFIVPRQLLQRKVVDNIFGYLESPNSMVDSNVGYATNEDYKLSAINLTTTDLTFLSAPIQYSYKATIYNNGSPYREDYERIVTPGKMGTATIEDITFDDNIGERVLIANSSTSFSLYARMSSISSAISPMISESGLTLYGIQWNINNLGISANNVIITQQGSGFSNGQTISITRTSNTMSNTVITDAVLTTITGANGNIVGVNVISPGSHYASNPIISVTGGSTEAVLTFEGETSSRGGNAQYRYITKPVILSPGFDAGDLRVYYTAYRPINTNIYVYYKILNRNDIQAFSDGDWQLMTTISGETTFSSVKDQLFEFVAAPYQEPTIGIPSNKVSYTSKVSGEIYTEFYQFAIKVVATSPDPTKVPYIKDIRGIALPPGV